MTATTGTSTCCGSPASIPGCRSSSPTAGSGFPTCPGANLTATADNVYLEMCSSFAQIQTVREVARTVPRHKFMFGTDAPLLDPGFVLGTYQDAAIPADQQAAVYYDNAARLFGID